MVHALAARMSTQASFFIGKPPGMGGWAYSASGTRAVWGQTPSPRGAFESDCGSWEASGTDIFLFEVGFKNTTNHALTLVLRNLVLHSRDGRSFAPVNVRSQAKFPTSFLNE